MTTYAESGVNIEEGDAASRAAYTAAKTTFEGRKGMIGQPVILDGGFAGMLDFGDFYLVQNDDGVGSKIEIARLVGDYSTVGYDLLAMVADDAVCLGAEVVSITNTVDCTKVDPAAIEQMLNGLAAACREQKVVIPGGEIAEMGSLVNGMVWNAAAVGVVAKDRVITGKEIKVGDLTIGLPSAGFRSNGFSLVRHVLKKNLGEEWYNLPYPTEDGDGGDSSGGAHGGGVDHGGKTWGQVALTPCEIYHDSLLQLLGRYGAERKVNIHGIVHITGGGIPGNIPRVLGDLGIDITNPMPVPDICQRVIKMGNISHEEAHKTWNMGMAMALFVDPSGETAVLEHFNGLGIKAQTVGVVTGGGLRY